MPLSALALLALATVAATPQKPAPAKEKPASAKAELMVVRVEAARSGGGGALAWTKAITDALTARKDEFSLAKAGEPADVTIRIASVAEGEGGEHRMIGALVRGKTEKPFNLSYPGEVAPQAEKLVRNLRKLVDKEFAETH
jgi:hypothetical protein